MSRGSPVTHVDFPFKLKNILENRDEKTDFFTLEKSIK